MDNIVLIIVLLYCFGFSSHGLVLQKPLENSDPEANFYEVDITNESDQRASLDYLKNSKGNTELALVVLVPKDSQDYKVVLEKNEHYDKYVIVKTKPKLLDLEPYSQHHVDKHKANKQMVMWLNLYCDMHPDCDKNKLNEELRKFLLDIFGNPVKDFQNTFIKEKEVPKTSSVREDPSRQKKDDNSQPKMIDVPPNAQRCDAGSYMDVNGVCRQPW
ncbi:hypothetical protein HF086_015077 [Spodoptera exigua]|uniref:Uncharacterized protein n=1 Tax=Spodoptera exigua TaxID=7107 RepID=A0A922SKP0_SPOEX|nr:hypothetical protein HF086_015077 [Spodoptera exigua]